MRSARPHERGFTLVEVLVALLILSLLGTLVYELSLFTLRFRSTTEEQLAQAREVSLREGWLTSSLRAAYPDYDGLEGGLTGSSRELELLSLAPPHEAPGTPSRIAWRLLETAQGGELRFASASGEDWLVHRWRRGDAAFSYLDADGRWRDRWPPGDTDDEHLPAAVRLDYPEIGGPRSLVVAIDTSWAPPAWTDQEFR
jgi:prepilin-type N-terminal cleavage/methylation domain-containing protein